MEVGGSGQHEAVRLAAAVRSSSSDLAATSLLTLSVRERTGLLLDLERARRALDAASLAVVRSLDGDDLSPVGASNLAMLLGSRLQRAPGRARADVEAARATDPDAPAPTPTDERGTLAGMGRALRDGAVSRDHVDVAVRTLTRVPCRMRARACRIVDGFFVDVSRRHPPRECENLARQLLDRLDPDRSERGYDPDAFARRGFDMVTDATGMLVVRGQLDPLTGAQIKAAVEHYAAPDPAVTGDDGIALGRDPRTPSQRRADALGVVARQGLASAGTRGGEPPRVVVHATLDQLAALAAGRDHAEQAAAGRAWCDQTGFVTPDVLARMGCGALFERVLLAPSGAVLRLGRSARLASAAQRRALAARDGGCVVPGCGRPASQCDAHHVTAWAAGGLTDVDQLVLLCGPHHSAVHAGHVAVRVREGVPEVLLPACADPQRRWRRRSRQRDAALARAAGERARLLLADGRATGPPPGPPPIPPPGGGPPGGGPPGGGAPAGGPPGGGPPPGGAPGGAPPGGPPAAVAADDDPPALRPPGRAA